MSRADLIVNLVRAGTQGDQGLFRSTVEAMAAEERAKHHHQLAERLEENLREANARPKPAEVVRSFDGGHGEKPGPGMVHGFASWVGFLPGARAVLTDAARFLKQYA